MKRTQLKGMVNDLYKAMDQNGFGRCEVMELKMKTCVTSDGELFVHAEATIEEPGENGKCHCVTKDFDL